MPEPSSKKPRPGPPPIRRTERSVGPHELFVETYHPRQAPHARQVLCIGGAFDGSWIYSRFAPGLAQMGWTVHCMNLRGFYKSACRDVGSLSFADYVADVATVRRELGLESPILVGYSVGGLIAMKSAEQLGAGAVVLYDTSPSREIAHATGLPPTRDFVDVHGRVPPVLQFIPSQAIVEEMWGRRVSPDEFKKQLSLFRRSFLSGRAFREMEIERPSIGRIDAPILILGISSGNRQHHTMFHKGGASWYAFEGYSHGSLLVSPLGDRITRMVLSWLSLGCPVRKIKFFRNTVIGPDGPDHLLPRGGSFRGTHSRRIYEKPGTYLMLYSEGILANLRYYSGWHSPIVVVVSGKRTFQVPMTRMGDGRRPGESLFGAAVELRDRDGFFIRGDSGEDRPGPNLLYKPELKTAYLSDGEFFPAPPPRDPHPPRFVDLVHRSHKLEHDYIVKVRLPRNYDAARTYPVAVLNDGQNQWHGRGPYGGWHTDASADELIRRGKMREIILVGVNCHRFRNRGYLPPPLGQADRYVHWLADDLLPHLRTRFNISWNPSEIAIIGASYGANNAVYAGLLRPDVFGLVGALSFAYLKGNPQLKHIESLHHRPFRRLYADCGTRWADDQPHRDDNTGLTRKLITSCQAKWMTHGKDLLGLVADGHQHNEACWRQRIGGCLRFLFRTE